MIAGATPMRTSVKANVIVGLTTTRSQAAISPMPPARTGPSTAAIDGAGCDRAAPSRAMNEVESPTRPVTAFLQVGAGAEHRGRVGEDDHAHPGLVCLVERSVQGLDQQLPGQSVAVGGRIERDGGDPSSHLDG